PIFALKIALKFLAECVDVVSEISKKYVIAKVIHGHSGVSREPISREVEFGYLFGHLERLPCLTAIVSKKSRLILSILTRMEIGDRTRFFSNAWSRRFESKGSFESMSFQLNFEEE